jgi:uncharacterized protein (TIGR02246 family)
MTRTSSASDARAVLQAYLDALVAGDIDKIADSFTEDATWWLHGDLPLSGLRRGRAAIMDFLTNAGALYQPGTQQFTWRSITAEGDRAVLEWRVQAVAAQTGKQYDNEYCGMFVVCDGRIAEVREYLDSLYSAQTMFAAR